MKKLNDVLNGVMNDILSESGNPNPVTGYNSSNVPGKFFFGSEVGAGDPEVETGGMSNGVATPAYAEPGIADRMAAMWAGLSDAQKMAILGGVGGTALAAGAGALYLRRKQRDANRALGR